MKILKWIIERAFETVYENGLFELFECLNDCLTEMLE